MTLKEEMKKAQDEGKIFIPPYKMNEMMKVSSKIVKLLTENANAVTFGYNDMKIIMKIVNNSLEEHIQSQPCSLPADN